MLRLRPYKKCDAEKIVSWIGDERAFRKWCADKFEKYPITADDLNKHYEDMAYSDSFFPLTAFDETGAVGHLIMRFTDEEKKSVRFGFVIVDSAKRGCGYGKELISLSLRYAFTILKAEKATIVVFDSNPPAYHCYRKAGFCEAEEPDDGCFHILGEDWKCILLERGNTFDYGIRELTADEYGVLDDFLYEALFIPEGAAPPSRDIINKPELRIYADDFGKKDDHALAASVGDNIIGCVWVRIMDDYGHIADDIPSLAISLYKPYRSGGIGTALMKRMLSLLREKGYKKVSLSVQKANYAKDMYLKTGFEIISENDEDYIMVCDLSKQK